MICLGRQGTYDSRIADALSQPRSNPERVLAHPLMLPLSSLDSGFAGLHEKLIHRRRWLRETNTSSEISSMPQQRISLTDREARMIEDRCRPVFFYRAVIILRRRVRLGWLGSHITWCRISLPVSSQESHQMLKPAGFSRSCSLCAFIGMAENRSPGEDDVECLRWPFGSAVI